MAVCMPREQCTTFTHQRKIFYPASFVSKMLKLNLLVFQTENIFVLKIAKAS